MKMKFAIALLICIIDATMAKYWIIPIPLHHIARQNNLIPTQDSMLIVPTSSDLSPGKDLILPAHDNASPPVLLPQYNYAVPPVNEQQPLIASLNDMVPSEKPLIASLNDMIASEKPLIASLNDMIAPGSDSSSSETKKKKQKKLSDKSKCNCPKIYNPICANNITFLNQCEYQCKNYYRLMSGHEGYKIDCSGACPRCNYIKKNQAVQYEEDYYVVPQEQQQPSPYLQSTMKPRPDDDADTDEDY